jgi:DNA helicase-2/ATP-dependent DNA helicase PcrA
MSQDNFQQNYKLLNPEQLQAVDSLYGPIMVVAGPGTGKTQIISLRTANIILKAGVDPENILITTFTEA